MSTPTHGQHVMTEQILHCPGLELCIETFGDPADPALLLIAGAASSMDGWDPEFCARLATGRRFVIRYDHRDTGRSSSSPAGAPDYTFDDLATDPLRILETLGIARAHLVGVSMGGGIAQQLAAQHPANVRTITLVATGPGGERSDPHPLPGPSPAVAATFEDPPAEPDWTDPSAVVEYLVEAERPYAGSNGFDAEGARRRATATVGRSADNGASSGNHWKLVGEGRSFRMADIGVPALVLHGTSDPLFPLEHGRALASEIADARLIPLEGMGHESPPEHTWDVVVPAILEFTAAETSG